MVEDCTGRATTRAGAEAHLAQGAKRVLVSAASKTLQDCDAVLLPGINMEMYDPREHRIIRAFRGWAARPSILFSLQSG